MTAKRSSNSRSKKRRFRRSLWLLAVPLFVLAAVLSIFISGEVGEFVSSREDFSNATARPESPSRSSEFGPSPRRPCVAIIIDDFGPPLRTDVVEGFLKLPFAITVSVIPGNLKTITVHRRAKAAGKEVFIHLPMEPTEPVALNERDMVRVGTDSVELAGILDRVQAELPSAVGLNNHMGSRATADVCLMAGLAAELKRRGLAFVDSRTTPDSYALFAMRDAGVPALGRDVFLDYATGSKTIHDQLARLARIARQRGWAVGIGHARRATLDVLKEEMPRLAENGITFLSAGTLIELLNGGVLLDRLRRRRTTAHRSNINQRRMR